MENAVDLLVADHRRAEDIYALFVAEPSRQLAGMLCGELLLHTALEETILYPTVRDQVSGGGALANAAEHDHAELKSLIAEIEASDDSLLVELVGELMASVADHVRDEETRILPAIADRLGPARLDVMGRLMAEFRASRADRFLATPPS